MKPILTLALVLSLAVPTFTQAAPSDRVLANDPAWHNADVIQKAGIVLGGRRAFTRRDIADATARLMREAANVPAIANQLTASPPALAALNALVAEFAPELTAAGQSVPQYKSTLAALAPGHPLVGRPFPDVPKDHWAASAVETLRRRGIVKGYPATEKR